MSDLTSIDLTDSEVWQLLVIASDALTRLEAELKDIEGREDRSVHDDLLLPIYRRKIGVIDALHTKTVQAAHRAFAEREEAE